MFGIFEHMNAGAIGVGDKTKLASDKSKQPQSLKEGETITRSEARSMIDQGVNRKVPSTAKSNKLSEGGQDAQKMKDRLKEKKGGGLLSNYKSIAGKSAGMAAKFM